MKPSIRQGLLDMRQLITPIQLTAEIIEVQSIDRPARALQALDVLLRSNADRHFVITMRPQLQADISESREEE